MPVTVEQNEINEGEIAGVPKRCSSIAKKHWRQAHESTATDGVDGRGQRSWTKAEGSAAGRRFRTSQGPHRASRCWIGASDPVAALDGAAMTLADPAGPARQVRLWPCCSPPRIHPCPPLAPRLSTPRRPIPELPVPACQSLRCARSVASASFGTTSSSPTAVPEIAVYYLDPLPPLRQQALLLPYLNPSFCLRSSEVCFLSFCTCLFQTEDLSDVVPLFFATLHCIASRLIVVLYILPIHHHTHSFTPIPRQPWPPSASPTAASWAWCSPSCSFSRPSPPPTPTCTCT
ncbi:hypothetical protein DM02DRAFT_382478 [Periconia macrospinosa]|uniref:Uncharacterized protein n=1 Tax=Periconia macrospinosa TaxID=97972 RepID=A0A2V1E908_9PLEO|nr:hypothetical protein DM02DRAFT_382478 [Periconia macrospinosa]